MKISELIEQLEQQLKFEGDLEVRIAYQKSYPLAAYLESVTLVEADDDDERATESIVWLAASEGVYNSDSPYAPQEAWENSY
jgi:hypothetical protein